MDHIVMYRWRIKAGREADFEAAWSAGTNQIRGRGASGGAELFADPEGIFYSLARWPSAASQDEYFAGETSDSESWPGEMEACILERLPEIPLTRMRELLKGEKTFHTVPTLSTERLTLRPLVLDDAAQVAPALMDEDNMRYWSRGALESVEDVREYITWNVVPNGVECFAITESTAPEVALGWVILMDRGAAQIELGYILRPDAQGRGIAREAVTRAISYGFETRGVRRIYADIDPDNTRSRTAVEALGFSYEGRLRATWETHLGVRDSVIYSLLNSDPR
ncbi:MAG: GNAT family N-acetyltransferase [Myxococcales bacterium]|nr:GNAT family N-acetyltransferase [Myxococcales bacterium]